MVQICTDEIVHEIHNQFQYVQAGLIVIIENVKQIIQKQ